MQVTDHNDITCPSCLQKFPQIRVGGATVRGESMMRYHCTGCSQTYCVGCTPSSLALVLVMSNAVAEQREATP